MKPTAVLFIFSLILLIGGCTESSKSSKSSSSNPYCQGSSYYYYGCPGYTGGAAGGSGSTDCTVGNNYWTQSGCAGYAYCQSNPTYPACTSAGSTTGTTTGGTTTNTYPYYYSAYVDKNWAIQYPYIPSMNCAEATAPSGITYTPYETRKGTVTLKGQVDYDPASGQAYFDTTSSMLQSVSKARNFFWGDSTLKVRFKSNVQPAAANTTNVCPGRTKGSSIKGYGKIKFDLYLVGRKANGTETTINLGTKIVSVNSCTPAIDLSGYAAQYPNGIYLKVKNVYGNQNWAPGTYTESQYYDQYGFVSPQNPYVDGAWKLIRNMDCWSLDIEVASDGTKTFN